MNRSISKEAGVQLRG